MERPTRNDRPTGPRRPGADESSRLEAIVRGAATWLGPIRPSSGRRLVALLVLIVAVAIASWTAVYTVPSDSVAVIQRFGKYRNIVPPGLHMKLPLGADQATIVPVKRQLKQEFGFATPGATDATPAPPPES